MPANNRKLNLDLEEIKSLYGSGLSTVKTGKRLGVSHTTIRSLLLMHGIKLRGRTETQIGTTRPNFPKRKPQVSKNCPNCGKTITGTRFLVDKYKYCSWKCAGMSFKPTGVRRKTLPKVFCKGCKRYFSTPYKATARPRKFCSPECYRNWYLGPAGPKSNTSIEKKVFGWLKDARVKFVSHRKVEGFFPDVLILSHKLIIECNGDYWHRRPYIRRKDAIRSEILENAGYKLLHLWEKDINEDPNLCKQRIHAFLEDNGYGGD